ncbi:RHOMBOID-like protein 5 [Alnus glutinosa]|uniref:RHOMBOID-like protein 5 n=1 Tax=Alnus glutinosa TaxID=3517 RepID=UPI002D786601|nr:RHOMBOID-like protein 5 [Alnus glutinosa]
MGKRPPPPCDIECGPHKARPPPPPSPYFHPPASESEPWFAWLVPLIFAANVTMFAYTMYANDCPAHTGKEKCLLGKYLGRLSFQPFKENALLGPSTTVLVQLGGLENKLVVEKGEGWRLLSCMWLHAGVIHLVANMLSLLFIGIRLEQEFGFVRIGVLYLLSGFGGSLLSALNSKSSISVGASGALFGLLGAMLSELLTNWTIYANKCAALVTLVVIIGINLGVGFLPRVDNSAHVGGFVSGFLLGFILLVRPQFGYVSRKYIPTGYDIKRIHRHTWYQYLFWITALLLLIIGYAYCCVTLFKGETAYNLPF